MLQASGERAQAEKERVRKAAAREAASREGPVESPGPGGGLGGPDDPLRGSSPPPPMGRFHWVSPRDQRDPRRHLTPISSPLPSEDISDCDYSPNVNSSFDSRPSGALSVPGRLVPGTPLEPDPATRGTAPPAPLETHSLCQALAMHPSCMTTLPSPLNFPPPSIACHLPLPPIAFLFSPSSRCL